MLGVILALSIFVLWPVPQILGWYRYNSDPFYRLEQICTRSGPEWANGVDESLWTLKSEADQNLRDVAQKFDPDWDVTGVYLIYRVNFAEVAWQVCQPLPMLQDMKHRSFEDSREIVLKLLAKFAEAKTNLANQLEVAKMALISMSSARDFCLSLVNFGGTPTKYMPAQYKEWFVAGDYTAASVFASADAANCRQSLVNMGILSSTVPITSTK